MKKNILYYLLLITCFIPSIVFGQLKRQDNPIQINKEIRRPVINNISGLGFFDPAKFNMSHSFSMSYFTAGNNSLSRGVYLNTLSYHFLRLLR